MVFVGRPDTPLFLNATMRVMPNSQMNLRMTGADQCVIVKTNDNREVVLSLLFQR